MKFKRILVVGGLVVYLLVASEIFLRVFSPMALMPRYIWAAEYGVRANKPNAHYFHATPDYRNEFRINSKGVRSNEEIPYEKPEGEKRIVFLGDSFTIGYDATLEQSFAAQFESQLKARGIPAKVINLGVSGHGTAEELITLKAEGLKYQPDLVVVGWHQSTDFDDNVRSNLFRLDGESLVQVNETYLPSVEVQRILFSFALYEWLACNSHLQVFVRDLVAETVKEALVVLRGTPKRPATIAAENAPAAPKSPAAVMETYPARLSVALMREMERVTEEAGAKLLVLDIPRRNDKEYVNGIMCSPEVGDLGLMVYCAANDLNQHLDKQLVWERSSFHFTPFGNELVAEGMVRTTLENGLLD